MTALTGDPCEDTVRLEEALDHRRAIARGERLGVIATSVVRALFAEGLLADQDAAGVVICSELAQHLYAGAVDLPEMRGRR
jgi:hypothetical protein